MRSYLLRHYKSYYCQGTEYYQTYTLVYGLSEAHAIEKLRATLNKDELAKGEIVSCTIL